MALERLGDAQTLLLVGRFSCAYYIAGYAVECALKACIARQTKQDDFPPRDAGKYYTHDLAKLLDGAALAAHFTAEASRDPSFRSNWAVVKDWAEEARYQSHSRQQAEELLAAITDGQHGVLQWLRRHW